MDLGGLVYSDAQLAKRRDVMDRWNAARGTLGGKRAVACGAKNPHASLFTVGNPSRVAEVAWSTLARVLDSGRADIRL